MKNGTLFIRFQKKLIKIIVGSKKKTNFASNYWDMV